ncbi:hypothetical protein [Flavobacterium sp.]|uniref:hypothetical protein n=1 Tax=Flavobacterium sp. TaxID=239 RepID=UPI002B4AD84E|nr:hypothetical protein [Flavobacterium sp.]
MKNITYAIGIFALLVTMSSCTADELEQANEMNNTMTTNTVESAREGDIDPPIPMPLP